jgi:endonuclease YncB( thermonuclease family)
MILLLSTAILTGSAGLSCVVSKVTDGDTIRCASGERVRLAGIEAAELRGGCHLPVCPTMPGREAKQAMSRLVLGRPLRCTVTGTSYSRLTAFCKLPGGADLSCEAIRRGIAVRWERYDPRGKLKGCGR